MPAGRIVRMVSAELLAQAQQLSPVYRLQLIDALWQSLAPHDLPVSAADRKLVDERLRDLRENPLAERSWEDVKADTRSRIA